MNDSTAEDQVMRPLLSVVHGAPTDDELVALLAVIASRSGSADDDPTVGPTSGSAWGARKRAMRDPLVHGPDAWRRSALPR